jgi:branched-chain amino acid transport system permease protein
MSDKPPFAILGFRPLEIAFWTAAVAAPFFFPRQLLILNEIAILALFAISLDLILGYAGIVSLGHAAFLGFGAYGAGLLALHVTADPIIGLIFAIVISAALGR